MKIQEFIVSLIMSMTIFLVPIKGIMILVGLFIFLDTAFGVWAAIKLKQDILSSKLSRIASKMLVYQLGVVLFYGIDLFIFKDLMAVFNIEIEFLLTKLIGLSFIGLEIHSIDEKIRNVKDKGILYHFKTLIKSAKIIKKEYENLNNE